MLITIDGLSGTGKSSISKLLAEELNLKYISSGDYFRSYAYIINKEHLAINESTINYLKSLNIKRDNNRLLINNEDITPFIKTKENNIESARIANNKLIQDLVDDIEHNLVDDNVIIDGRDVNTRFNNADYKIFLTASSELRKSRVNMTDEEIKLRDKYDLEGNIKKSSDIIEIDTDGKTLGEIISEILNVIGG